MSRKMIDYKVEDGKIVSIDGYEVGGGGGYEIKKLTITKNGLYDSEFEAYKPVVVNVPQISEDGVLLKNFIDARGTADYLFYKYGGTSVDELISYTYTSNVTSMDSTFSSCFNLTTIPLLDTSNVTNMHSMFETCTNLTTIPLLDTSNVTNMRSMFASCAKLVTVPAFNASKVESLEYMFSGCTSLTSIGIYGFRSSIDISKTVLEHDAIVALLNQAGTANNSYCKITMGSAKLALLSDEEKAIATNKGWTLA